MKKVYLKEKRVKCDCGSDVKLRSYKFHLTSKKHKKYLDTKESKRVVDAMGVVDCLESEIC